VQTSWGRHAYVCFDDPFEKDPLVGRIWAAKALKSLNQMRVGPGQEVLEVAFHQSKEKRKMLKEQQKLEKAKQLARVTVVARNFPKHFQDSQISQLFGASGKISKLQQKGKVIIIQYDEHAHAARAVQSLNGMVLDGYRLEVAFQNPLPKHIMYEHHLDRKSFMISK